MLSVCYRVSGQSPGWIQEMMEIKADDAVAQLRACANEENLIRLHGALLFAHAAIAAELSSGR